MDYYNHVFLYFTEHRSTYYVHTPPKNTVYQYDWDGKNLTNPILIKELSADSPIHNGGVFAKGQNEEIYFVIGDDNKRTIFQNYKELFLPQEFYLQFLNKKIP